MQLYKNSPTRKEILEDIGDCFQQIFQETSSSAFDKAAEYAHKAEALIELLEVNDTGNANGYIHYKSLWERFVLLYNRCDKIEKKKFGCGISSYERLNNFFMGLKTLY